MKKLLRTLAKTLLVLLLLPLVLLLFFWTMNTYYLGGTDAANTTYLTQNKQNLSQQLLSTATADAALFDSTFYSNQVFLLGENHGFADVQQIDKFMLLHLNKKIGLRYYVAEMDSSRAKNLNAFLLDNTPDTLLLWQVIRDIKLRIPQQSSKELYQKWLDVYNYNQTLPDSLKLTVIGVDKDFEDTSREIGRDSMMLVNFKNTVEKRGLQNEKFYGLFGYTHVLQSGIGEKNIYPFAAKIRRSDLPFANKVQSIACLTLDSEMALPQNEQFPSPPDGKTALVNADGPFTLVQGIRDLREVTSPHTITLFDLRQPGSPYSNSQKLAGIKVNLMGGDILPHSAQQVTTGFFQHVILVRNSRALTSLE
ncbi:hypothetical protein [Pontibacter akesuensis]|uniref:Erythromycin esterase homolog n=1 Tax=Pontibacter akesuensis TaxID=388950 RepID=A0A1I7HTF9_9BACT|nr:hypothetical protein [Pontibacter akesuensis]GHA63496.1 hypothetical protein GCM10007389_15060 [Pontibacter akesuensis]SFU64015.1 hypothetical protein SAMN04487941_1665 [Pontibacter akesuensis]